MSKKTRVAADQDGLRGWDEWNQHMNDPGYYTGGRRADTQMLGELYAWSRRWKR